MVQLNNGSRQKALQHLEANIKSVWHTRFTQPLLETLALLPVAGTCQFQRHGREVPEVARQHWNQCVAIRLDLHDGRRGAVISKGARNLVQSIDHCHEGSVFV